jgi:hypothetical protein
VAEQTVASCFEKPAAFAFTPGQFCEMTSFDLPETTTKAVRVFVAVTGLAVCVVLGGLAGSARA